MLRSYILTVVAITFAASMASAQEDLALEAPPTVADPKIVVFPTKGKGGPNLKSTVKKYIEKELKKEDFTLIPFGKFKKAARKAKIKTKDLASPMSAQQAGEGAGATHVLIVEGLMEKQEIPGKKRKKKVYFANVTLIDVSSGDVVYTERWELSGKKINKVVGVRMTEAITKSLSPPPAEEGIPDPEPDPVPEPPPGPPEPVGDPDPIDTSESDPAVASADPMPETVEPSDIDSTEPQPIATEPSPLFPSPTSEPAIVIPEPMTAQADVKATVSPTSKRTARWRPGIHAVGGVLAMTRTARIKAKNAPQTPPCFCVPEETGGFNPIFPAGYLGVELFPLAIGGDGGFLEGIGLHLDGYFTRVSTIIDAAGTQVESNVFGGRGGLSYRLVPIDSEISPDIRFDVGMEYFAFPLSAGAFPGVRYWSQLYAGFQITQPLLTKYVAITAGGHYTFLFEPQGKTKKMGDSVRRYTAFMVQGGFIGSWEFLELRLIFRYEKFEERYNGVTDLDLGVQFEGAKLTDELVGGIAAFGVRF